LAQDPEILREGWLRAAAELENLRKRTAAEIGAARKEERIAILSALLEVMDNLERALDFDDAMHAQRPFARGVRAAYEQMLGLLKRFGAHPIEALGEAFDPHDHEALRTVDLPDQPPGVVAEVLQTGYRMSDGSVLRPAKVAVVQRPGNSA
jgi:molecular chaperone GrpE